MATPLKIITSTTRPGRSVDLVLPWLANRFEADERFDTEVVDLREWKLPLFQETRETIGDFSDPTYSDPIVRAWNRKMSEGHAFVFVTAEYNHSVPGELKNALDNVFVSQAFRNKPMAFVGYSGGPIGGARAVEHLAHIAIEAEAVALRNTVLIGGVAQAFDADGEPTNLGTEAALRVMKDDIAWWAAALDRARAEGELLPGNARFMQELEALSAPKETVGS
jgi:NAD(P)H-dependent FMN reductase